MGLNLGDAMAAITGYLKGQAQADEMKREQAQRALDNRYRQEQADRSNELAIAQQNLAQQGFDWQKFVYGDALNREQGLLDLQRQSRAAGRLDALRELAAAHGLDEVPSSQPTLQQRQSLEGKVADKRQPLAQLAQMLAQPELVSQNEQPAPMKEKQQISAAPSQVRNEMPTVPLGQASPEQLLAAIGMQPGSSFRLAGDQLEVSGGAPSKQEQASTEATLAQADLLRGQMREMLTMLPEKLTGLRVANWAQKLANDLTQYKLDKMAPLELRQLELAVDLAEEGLGKARDLHDTEVNTARENLTYIRAQIKNLGAQTKLTESQKRNVDQDTRMKPWEMTIQDRNSKKVSGERSRGNSSGASPRSSGESTKGKRVDSKSVLSAKRQIWNDIASMEASMQSGKLLPEDPAALAKEAEIRRSLEHLYWNVDKGHRLIKPQERSAWLRRVFNLYYTGRVDGDGLAVYSQRVGTDSTGSGKMPGRGNQPK